MNRFLVLARDYFTTSPLPLSWQERGTITRTSG